MTIQPADNPSRRIVGGAPLHVLGNALPDDFPRTQAAAASIGYRMACGDETVATVTPTTHGGARAWRITYRNTNPRIRS